MKFSVLRDRRVVLGIVVVALVPAFVITQAIVVRYRARRHQLAVEWAERGQRDLSRHPAAAVADFQTALSYTIDTREDRLRLAEALIAAQRPVEARAHLVTLWTEEPGNGVVNLELARLAAADDDVQAAVRYYHAAIDGAWETGGAAARRQARVELARWLIEKGQQTRAQAELIALIDDLPDDATQITDIASLLVEAGADNRAIVLLRRALDLDPVNTRAAQLAGEIEFRSGDFPRARQYLSTAKAGALPARDEAMLATSERGIALDGSSRGLSASQRTHRLHMALDAAVARLKRCQQSQAPDAATSATVAGLALESDRLSKSTERALLRDADLTDRVKQLVFDIEGLPESVCGPDSADDRALQIMAARGQLGTR